jgi:pimeloyl-ACP methyl ester carboxylesterase
MLCHIPHRLNEESPWVVFLHGLGGNSNIFYKQVDEYKKHFNLMFVDLFGHGCTLEQLNEYTFQTLANGVINVLDEEKIDSVHLIGVSLGTIVMDAFAHLAPTRIKSMVLSGAVMGYDLRARFLLKCGGYLQWMMPYMWLYRLFALIMMPRKAHKKSRQIFSREAKKLGGREFHKWYKLMESLEPFYASLPGPQKNKIPRLYISGDEDYLFIPYVVQTYLRDPLASIHVIEKCGHVCSIEKPEEFNKTSISYFKSYPDVPKHEHIPENTHARKILMKLSDPK